MLVLTETDVKRIFTMDQALRAAEIAASAHTAGNSLAPRRAHLESERPAGEFLVMPGVVDQTTFGVKIWYRFDEALGLLPKSNACMVLLDVQRGEEVLLDGGVLTDLRTGALTGVAARFLARKDSASLAILGSGIQARTQVLALSEALPQLQVVRVSSRSRGPLERFVQSLTAELASLGSDLVVEMADSPQDAVEGSDIVVAATTSSTPVIKDEWIKEGAMVCSVGSHDPESSELEAQTVARAEVVAVDTVSGAVDGAGDIAQAIQVGSLSREAVIELGQLVTGDAEGRAAEAGITVFKSVGFAAADIVAASLIAELAFQQGVGTRIDLHA